MAYLKDLIRKCRDCHRDAVVELYNRFHKHMAFYCRQHGQRALDTLEHDEIAALRASELAEGPLA